MCEVVISPEHSPILSAASWSQGDEEYTTMLPQLRLMRLRFEMEIEADASLPPYKGDLLRRALLWHLGAIWCQQFSL